MAARAQKDDRNVNGTGSGPESFSEIRRPSHLEKRGSTIEIRRPSHLSEFDRINALVAERGGGQSLREGDHLMGRNQNGINNTSGSSSDAFITGISSSSSENDGIRGRNTVVQSIYAPASSQSDNESDGIGGRQTVVPSAYANETGSALVPYDARVNGNADNADGNINTYNNIEITSDVGTDDSRLDDDRSRISETLSPLSSRLNESQLDGGGVADHDIASDESDGNDELDEDLKLAVELCDPNSPPPAPIEHTVWQLQIIVGVLALKTLPGGCLVFLLLYTFLVPPEYDRSFARICVIPVVSALFTWLHIWLAIQMIFAPVEFLGLWQLNPPILLAVPKLERMDRETYCLIQEIQRLEGRLESVVAKIAKRGGQLQANSSVDWRIAPGSSNSEKEGGDANGRKDDAKIERDTNRRDQNRRETSNADENPDAQIARKSGFIGGKLVLPTALALPNSSSSDGNEGLSTPPDIRGTGKGLARLPPRPRSPLLRASIGLVEDSGFADGFNGNGNGNGNGFDAGPTFDVRDTMVVRDLTRDSKTNLANMAEDPEWKMRKMSYLNHTTSGGRSPGGRGRISLPLGHSIQSLSKGSRVSNVGQRISSKKGISSSSATSSSATTGSGVQVASYGMRDFTKGRANKSLSRWDSGYDSGGSVEFTSDMGFSNSNSVSTSNNSFTSSDDNNRNSSSSSGGGNRSGESRTDRSGKHIDSKGDSGSRSGSGEEDASDESRCYAGLKVLFCPKFICGPMKRCYGVVKSLFDSFFAKVERLRQSLRTQGGTQGGVLDGNSQRGTPPGPLSARETLLPSGRESQIITDLEAGMTTVSTPPMSSRPPTHRIIHRGRTHHDIRHEAELTRAGRILKKIANGWNTFSTGTAKLIWSSWVLITYPGMWCSRKVGGICSRRDGGSVDSDGRRESRESRRGSRRSRRSSSAEDPESVRSSKSRSSTSSKRQSSNESPGRVSRISSRRKSSRRSSRRSSRDKAGGPRKLLRKSTGWNERVEQMTVSGDGLIMPDIVVRDLEMPDMVPDFTPRSPNASGKPTTTELKWRAYQLKKEIDRVTNSNSELGKSAAATAPFPAGSNLSGYRRFFYSVKFYFFYTFLCHMFYIWQWTRAIAGLMLQLSGRIVTSAGAKVGGAKGGIAGMPGATSGSPGLSATGPGSGGLYASFGSSPQQTQSTPDRDGAIVTPQSGGGPGTYNVNQASTALSTPRTMAAGLPTFGVPQEMATAGYNTPVSLRNTEWSPADFLGDASYYTPLGGGSVRDARDYRSDYTGPGDYRSSQSLRETQKSMIPGMNRNESFMSINNQSFSSLDGRTPEKGDNTDGGTGAADNNTNVVNTNATTTTPSNAKDSATTGTATGTSWRANCTSHIFKICFNNVIDLLCFPFRTIKNTIRKIIFRSQAAQSLTIQVIEVGGPGIGLGWQGVIPRKSEKMARTAYLQIKHCVMNVEEICGRMDGVLLAEVMEPHIDEILTRQIKNNLSAVLESNDQDQAERQQQLQPTANGNASSQLALPSSSASSSAEANGNDIGKKRRSDSPARARGRKTPEKKRERKQAVEQRVIDRWQNLNRRRDRPMANPSRQQGPGKIVGRNQERNQEHRRVQSARNPQSRRSEVIRTNTLREGGDRNPNDNGTGNNVASSSSDRNRRRSSSASVGSNGADGYQSADFFSVDDGRDSNPDSDDENPEVTTSTRNRDRQRRRDTRTTITAGSSSSATTGSGRSSPSRVSPVPPLRNFPSPTLLPSPGSVRSSNTPLPSPGLPPGLQTNVLANPPASSRFSPFTAMRTAFFRQAVASPALTTPLLQGEGGGENLNVNDNPNSSSSSSSSADRRTRSARVRPATERVTRPATERGGTRSSTRPSARRPPATARASSTTNSNTAATLPRSSRSTTATPAATGPSSSSSSATSAGAPSFLTRWVTNSMANSEWLANYIRKKAGEKIREKLPELIDNMKTIFIKEADVEEFIVGAFRANRDLLNEFFKKIGKNEFEFIQQMGLWGGLVLGFMQLFIFNILCGGGAGTGSGSSSGPGGSGVASGGSGVGSGVGSVPNHNVGMNPNPIGAVNFLQSYTSAASHDNPIPSTMSAHEAAHKAADAAHAAATSAHNALFFARIFLPISGAIIGCFTNYLAIQACFRPVHPIDYTFLPSIFGNRFSIRIQGLFLRRQRTVCAVYARMLTVYLLNLNKMTDYIKSIRNGAVWEEIMVLYDEFVADNFRACIPDEGMSGFVAGRMTKMLFGNGASGSGSGNANAGGITIGGEPGSGFGSGVRKSILDPDDVSADERSRESTPKTNANTRGSQSARNPPSGSNNQIVAANTQIVARSGAQTARNPSGSGISTSGVSYSRHLLQDSSTSEDVFYSLTNLSSVSEDQTANDQTANDESEEIARRKPKSKKLKGDSKLLAKVKPSSLPSASEESDKHTNNKSTAPSPPPAPTPPIPFLQSHLQYKLLQSLRQEWSENKALMDCFLEFFTTSTRIESTNRKRMMAMTSDQFENLLRPVFQEDEWILVIQNS